MALTNNLIRRSHCVQDFFPQAAPMRAAFEELCRNPYLQQADTHGIWNYWHVPDLYTYLRTTPERLFPQAMVAAFTSHLKQWAVENLGLAALTPPQVHLY